MRMMICALLVLANCAVAMSDPLPIQNGERTLAGLDASVTVQRDKLGVPRISGESLHDVIRAQGFIHAQERFFQMDATRRLAAGELAEVLGQMLLPMDQQYRRYRFRHVASEIWQRLEQRERDMLRVYAEGVNAGLAALAAPPPEYGVLNVGPSPWRAEDGLLVLLAMFDMLHMEGVMERMIGVMRDALPEELVDFLTPGASRFDLPLLPGSDAEWEPMPIPGPEVIDVRGLSAADVYEDVLDATPLALGSNNWAVAGDRTSHGGAIIANDPHLMLSVPGIWFRAELHWPDHMLAGLTMPGLPGVVIGSNGHVAWGFTNTMGDFQDYIIIEVHPDDASLYRTPDGWERFGEVVERISVRGGAGAELRLRTTRWGVVTDTDHHGRPLVLKWTALDPDAVNLRIIDMFSARTIEEAVEMTRQWFGPSQNVLIASHDGRIAWVVSGYLPERIGFDGRNPVSWADGDKGWRGPIPEDERPVVIDPPDGMLFTANNRTVGLEHARRLGGIWTAGERAGRIAEMLRGGGRFSEHDLFAMQLDARVSLFDFYRDLAMEASRDILLADDANGLLADARAVLHEWNGTADADQPAMRLLDAYRRALHARVLAPLLSPCRELSSLFRYRWFMEEEPVRRILEERPEHLLPPGYDSWDDVLTVTWVETVDRMAASGLRTPWGESNRTMIVHPLAQAMPFLAKSLNMPEDPQSGHPFAVRVATPTFGASARMVVGPGREKHGILHTPAGQSGNHLSPHYRDSHRHWLEGRPLPFAVNNPGRELLLVPD